jgi:hypothetical protein
MVGPEENRAKLNKKIDQTFLNSHISKTTKDKKLNPFVVKS